MIVTVLIGLGSTGAEQAICGWRLCLMENGETRSDKRKRNGLSITLREHAVSLMQDVTIHFTTGQAVVTKVSFWT